MKVKLKPKSEIKRIIEEDIEDFKEADVLEVSEEKYRKTELEILESFEDEAIVEVRKVRHENSTGFHYVFPWFKVNDKQYYGNIYPNWVAYEIGEKYAYNIRFNNSSSKSGV